MNIEITGVTRALNNWILGIVGPFRFAIVHFPDPSKYGIDGGRISKLWIAPRGGGPEAASYDRGWSTRPDPADADAAAALAAILARWN